jgi:signal transduction histidine kinase
MPSEVSTIRGDQLVEELQRALAEAREQQAATAEILRVISSSPMDLKRVFTEIAMSAARLCEAYDATIHQRHGDLLPLVAHYGPILVPDLLPLTRGVLAGRAVLDRQTIQVADLQVETDEYPEGSEIGRRLGLRTNLAVPLIRSGNAIGVIVIRRLEIRPFTERQMELAKTFADQAVIAIENTRLFEEVQRRNQDLSEALEQQTATAELLKVIGRSTFDLEPVFETLIESAVKLCGATRGFISRFDGKLLQFAAGYNVTPELTEYFKEHPFTVDRHSNTGRAAVERRTIHNVDVRADPEYTYGGSQVDPYRTVLAIPMLRADALLGVILIYRHEVLPFTDSQIALVETFADQAVIAIENTRLFEAEQARTRELQESLEYQTATSEVLNVISRSKFDLQPVLDTIVEAAARLCAADMATIRRRDGEVYVRIASYGLTPDFSEYGKTGKHPLGRGSIVGRVSLEGTAIQISDVLVDAEYSLDEAQRLGGYRTILGVPLLREGVQIGIIVLMRRTVQRFTENQIELVTTFADQAVIAIENARLFEEVQERTKELQESLEQQTATSDVLRVISSSLGELAPVFDVLLSNAVRICEAKFGILWLSEGDDFRSVAFHGVPPLLIEGRQREPVVKFGGKHPIRRVVDTRQFVHINDMSTDRAYIERDPRSVELVENGGARTVLYTPMLKDTQLIGIIVIFRQEVRPFGKKQIELLGNFAKQAVIAVENARLFEEVQARTRELAKTVDDLGIASQHKSQFVANMSHELRTPLAAILGYAELMQEGFYGNQSDKSMDALTRIRSNGKHLLGLINTVLDIAKIESGQFSLNIGEYAIGSIVETVRAATESLAETKKLALKTDVAKSLPFGLGDEQRLTQVLLNLVGNAIKFTDSGEVLVVANVANSHFTVSVTDTGPGIPEQHQSRIFEQFHQVDSSNTKAKGGTGLGLAIARQIVEMHGGRIWVDSTLGKGSTFQMELPVRAAAARVGQ